MASDSNHVDTLKVKKTVELAGVVNVYGGTAATRAAVRGVVGDTPPIGSLFVGLDAVATTKPNLYVKVANGAADTDWERVVCAAAD